MLVNLRFTLPLWRFQPYLLIGSGIQHGDWSTVMPELESFNQVSWDYVLRPAVGTDFYLSKHLVLFAELGAPVRFADWKNIPSQSNDNVQITLSGGLQIRF